MPLNEQIAQAAYEQYIRERDRYKNLAQTIHRECDKLVAAAGVQASVQSRAKSPESFRRKLTRYLREGNREKIERVEDAADAIGMIGDLAGIRIATYVEADRGRVVKMIKDRFSGARPEMSVVVDLMQKPSGYRATHCQVCLPEDIAGHPDYENIRDTSAEIQVCSMLAHVWNEIEHDMRYKVEIEWGDDLSLRDENLLQFKRATEQGDAVIESLLGLRSELTAKQMADEVHEHFRQLERFDVNASDVLREFVRLGYTSPQRVTQFVNNAGGIARGRELIGQINVGFGVAKFDDSLHLNPLSADVLLALLIEKHGGDLVAMYERNLKGEGRTLRAALIAQSTRDIGLFS